MVLGADATVHADYLEVTDLKQFAWCPRIPFYRYCLPRVRPVTYAMREGILSHHEEAEREERRSLRAYGLVSGERCFDLALKSSRLGLVGRLDLAIRLENSAVVVDYKLTRDPIGPHYQLQLAAYALLLEEAWNLPVTRAFIYQIPRRQAEEQRLTSHLRQKVMTTATAIRRIVEREQIPPPCARISRCVVCEFRRFCNDTL
jgi:CRISPR-associated exonuclease Cas4